MLTVDEDIATELDKVVCKLMKLALRTTKRRTTPPPAKWMQCKLLDLLTLTEKAIQRRKKHVLENSFNAIKFVSDFVEDDSKQKIGNLDEIEENHIENDNKDTSSNVIEAADNEYVRKINPDTVTPGTMLTAKALDIKSEQDSMERTKAWLNVDVEELPYPMQEMSHDDNSSEDSDCVFNPRHKQESCGAYSKEIKPLCLTPSSRTLSNKQKSKREEKKRKCSSTRITKKSTRKTSGNYNLVKNSDSNNPLTFDNYIVRLKRKSKENQCLTMRTSKPIPESLIDLCHPELKGEQCIKDFHMLNSVETTNNILVLNKPTSKIVAEESVIIDIIMDETLEMISCCKDAAFNAKETILSEISNKEQNEDLRNNIDINLCTRHEVSTENILARTIFLNDINEPSTSKGIRHNVSMDVQCGPDTLPAYPMLSASTSLVRIPQGYSMGITIHDGTTDTAQGTDCSTSTQEYSCDKIITPRSTSLGIKIKDSDVNIFPSNYTSTTTQEENSEALIRSFGAHCQNAGRRSWSPESNTVVNDQQIFLDASGVYTSFSTELFKPNTSNASHSGTEFDPSNDNICKSISQLDNATKNDNEYLILSSTDYRECKIIEKRDMKNTKPKLSCGGVHVHSYKDKQESEDIVFQGKWQQCEPKFARKKTQNTILAKKFYDSGNKRTKDLIKPRNVNAKDKILVKKGDKKDYKKPIQVRNNNSTIRQKTNEVVTESQKNASVKQSYKTNKDISLLKQTINVTKVASKIAMSSITSKNIKSAFTTKKPQITSTINVKNENNTQNKRKSYLPLYMRKRNAQMLKKINFNQSIDSTDGDLEDNKEIENPNITKLISFTMDAKTYDVKKDLLHFQNVIKDNTYLVFCNENPDNCTSNDKQQTVDTVTTEESITQNNAYVKHTRSCQSLNSSTCSSPNSIVTVRAVNTKSKNISYRRSSASSHNSNLNTSESDNATPNKTKKCIKRCKTMEKADNGKGSNNKENIPDTTENFSSKHAEQIVKSPFVSQHICVAQLKTDRRSMQTMTSKHKTLNKSSIKISTPHDPVDKKRSLSASISRRRSFQSGNNMVLSKNSMSDGGIEPSDLLLVLDRYEKVSGPNTVCIKLKQNSKVVTETINITNDMNQIVEELLNFIDFSMSDNLINCSLDANDSISSFETIKANCLNSTRIDSEKENSLNRTFDSVLENESTVSVANTRLTVTDGDLLSFKSITSVSKHSEYFIANNELNAAIGQIEFSHGSAAAVVPTFVTDIFERKEQQFMQKPPGSLASQAFSGFSLDCENVANDQPDPISLIDSETGSMAMGQARARQATSEELFISSRSSGSYQSCLIDEDAVVPNWLFQMISQQHAQVVEDQPLIGPQPDLVAQASAYDINGNPIEPGVIDAVAGAGDGRGIHSDQSQDSSGRGSTLSSSDTSSSPQSDTILADPSAFSDQIELLRDPVAISVVTSESLIDDSSREECSRNTEENDHVTLSVANHRRPRTVSNPASDISADISSIDTDAPDSSD